MPDLATDINCNNYIDAGQWVTQYASWNKYDLMPFLTYSSPVLCLTLHYNNNFDCGVGGVEFGVSDGDDDGDPDAFALSRCRRPSCPTSCNSSLWLLAFGCCTKPIIFFQNV